MKFGTERALYYFLFGLMSTLIVLSVAFVYLSTNGALKKEPIPSELVSAEEAGNTKPLPNYMLETLRSDELEQLKP